MTKILIECKGDNIKPIQEALNVKWSNITHKIKKTKEGVIVNFNGGLFNSSEFDLFNYINNKYTILKVKKVSRSFKDIHNVTNSKEFKENIKIIEEKIKPFYVVKIEDEWWVGIKDLDVKEFDLKKTIREIYKIGLCCGLVPTTLV